MAELRYMVGPVERQGPDYSKPLRLRDAMDRIHGFLDHENRDYQIRRKGDEWGAVRPGPKTYRRLHEIIERFDPGDTVFVRNVNTKIQWNLRVVDVAWRPDPMNTTGTQSIDLIAGATWDEFDQKFGLYSMGICANKPGQHKDCNAIDLGVRKPQSATSIHNAIREIANWQREHGRELQVLGIIVMYECCSWTGSSMSSWRSYGGTPHVSHTHTSGRPSHYAGWI